MIFIRAALAVALGLLVAGEPKLKTKKLDQKTDIPKGGKIHLVYRYTGEPLSRPATFEVFIRCKEDKKERLLKRWSMCSWNDYHFDMKEKTLTVEFLVGHVEPTTGKTDCEQHDEEQVSFDVCD
jgi:hypothetical protein